MTSPINDRTVGNEWTEHYRGLTLHINQSRECWWQVYNGTDRLYVENFPEKVFDNLLQLKPLGGRIRVTEYGDVLTRIDEDDTAETAAEYTQVWIGNVDLTGELIPNDDPEMGIPIQPTELSDGDLWPSVYDGARYSFTPGGRMWWKNTASKKRHPVTTDLPETIQTTLRQQKPQGGSFRITPSNDVITLVQSPATETIKNQFSELPALVRNIIKLRKEQAGLEMLPIYIGNLGDVTIDIESPSSLTDKMSTEEKDALEGWAASLGGTSPTSVETHTTSQQASQSDEEATKSKEESTLSTASGPESDDDEGSPPNFDDDPEDWLDLDMDATEDRINDR